MERWGATMRRSTSALWLALSAAAAFGGGCAEPTQAPTTQLREVNHESEPDARQLTTRERLSRDRTEFAYERLKSGETKLDLKGRLHQAAVARVGADGRLERGCVDTQEALDRWMSPDDAVISPAPAPGHQP